MVTRKIEPEVKEIPHRLDPVFVFRRFGDRNATGDVHDIADGLEDEERDTDRKEYRVYAEGS